MEYNSLICRSFCFFYKEGKENIACGGYEMLKKQLTPTELRLLTAQIGKHKKTSNKIPPANKLLAEMVCKHCDFRIDGCDFAENRSGPPCGGYILIEKLTQ
jgi:hypothetical protein